MNRYICNDCAFEIIAEEEPEQCEMCGADNFGFEDNIEDEED